MLESISQLRMFLAAVGCLGHWGSLPALLVAAKEHSLASYEGVIPAEELARHVQLVLTDRCDLSAGREFGVMSPSTWRLADLFAKHAFLLNGLGWGGMPMHAVAKEIEEGRLVELRIEDVPAGWPCPCSPSTRLPTRRDLQGGGWSTG